jgi:hypothetical protein
LSFWSVTGSLAAGLLVGAAAAVIIAAAAPIVAAVATVAIATAAETVVSAAVAATIADTAVTVGAGALAGTAALAGGLKIGSDYNNAQQTGNYDQLAFDTGSLLGGSVYALDNLEGDAELGFKSDYQGQVSSGEITPLQNFLNYFTTLPTDDAEVLGNATIGGFGATFFPWKWPDSNCP